MPLAAALECPRCGDRQPWDTQVHAGCPKCWADGVPVNYVCDFVADPSLARELFSSPRDRGRRLWDYAPLLPVDGQYAVELGEGGTPLVRLESTGSEWGMPRLFAKNEASNPTWSHKDRLCSVATTAARQLGARVITAASTGNHGASTAAYAARAGLPCVIFTLDSVPETMKTLIQSFGAIVVAAKSIENRNQLMNDAVTRYQWYPISNANTPPIGSSPYGVDGYKTIAYEIWEQMEGLAPNWVVVPTAYGDCSAGIHRGFEDLKTWGLIDKLPRIAGAEVFGGLAAGLDNGAPPLEPVASRPTRAFSIGGSHTTYQAIRSVQDTRGVAVTVTEEELILTQKALGQYEGLFAEAASAVALSATRRLVHEGTIGHDDSVVVILTSSGLKDPQAAAKDHPTVPVIGFGIDELKSAVKGQCGALARPVDWKDLFD